MPTSPPNSNSALKSGLLWLGSAAAVVRVIDMLALIVVLWFVTKNDLGVASIAIAVSTIAETVSGTGLGLSASIVQVPKLSRVQLHSSFWFCGMLGIAVGLATAALSPLVAASYDSPELVAMIGWLVARQIALALVVVPLQKLNRELRFREVAAVQTLSSLVAAIVRGSTAVFGAGAWSLVHGQVAQALALLVVVAFVTDYRPALAFSRKALDPLIRFGARLAAAHGIQQVSLHIDYFIIGRMLGVGVLGLYRVAFDVAMQVVMPIALVVTRTAVPVLSRLTHARGQFREAFLWTTRSLGLLCAPVLLALFVGVEDILVMLGDGEFIDALPAARVLLAAAYLRIHFQLFAPMLTAWGAARLVLRLEVVALAVLCAALFAALRLLGPSLGVVAAGIAWVVMYPALIVLALFLVRAETQLLVREFLRSAVPGFLTLAIVGPLAMAAGEATKGWVAPLLHLVGIVAVVVALALALAKVAFGIRIRQILRIEPEQPANTGAKEE